jgi:glyoxylase-like metal-dependent hydrolase (beta-lactamase superfamily II)
METLPFKDSEVLPLDEVAAGVLGLQILFVNVYGIAASEGGWVLVDCGLPRSASYLRRWVERNFAGQPPRAIVLTHGHFDHVGACSELASEWRILTYAHTLEHPFLSGRKQYPPPDPNVGGGLMSRLSPFYPRGPIDISEHLRPLPEDGTVPLLPGWRWIHTPGHTVGHVSLFREEDRLLIVGDAFCTVNQQSIMSVVRQKPELTGPPAYYTPDWVAAKASVQVLAALHPNTLAPGHGHPMTGAEIPEKLELLARDFDRIALPEHGRYVEQARAEMNVPTSDNDSTSDKEPAA